MDDYHEFYWDADAVSTYNGKPGAWVDPTPGKRYRHGADEMAPGPPPRPDVVTDRAASARSAARRPLAWSWPRRGRVPGRLRRCPAPGRCSAATRRWPSS